MSVLQDRLDEDARFGILALLAQAGEPLNIYILRSALEDFNHRLGLEKLREELRGLARRGCVELAATGHTVTLTEHGEDVVRGRVQVEGVRSHSPHWGC